MNQTPDMNVFELEERNRNYTRSLINLLVYLGIFFIATNFVVVIMIYIYAAISKLDPASLYVDDELIEPANLFVNSWTNFTVYVLGTVIIVLLSLRFLKEDYFKAKQGWQQFFSLVFQGIVLYFISNIVANLIMEALGVEGDSTNQEQIEMLIKSDYVVLILGTTILFAPFVEELIFRKSLFNLFDRKKRLHPATVIIVTAFLFASIHVIVPIINALAMQASGREIMIEFLHIIPYFLNGLALSYIYYQSNRNIWCGITLHFFINIFATITIFYL